MKNTLIFRNARIYNDDCSVKAIEYFVIDDKKIVYIGNEPKNYTGTEIDCGGNILSKPFCDHHCHFPSSALYDLFGYNLCSLNTVHEYVEYFKSRHVESPVIRAFGWSVDSLKDYFSTSSQTPLQFIDSIFPNKIAILFSMDFHSCWCNSMALDALKNEGIYCRFKDDEIPNGDQCILHEDIADKIFTSKLFSFNDSEIEQAMLYEQKRIISLGITEINSMMFIGISYWSALRVLKKLDNNKLLRIKINYAYTAYPHQDINIIEQEIAKSLEFRSDKLNLTSVKIYMDGVIDNHSAYLLEEYDDRDCRGTGIWDNYRLSELIDCAARFGLPIHAHSIGDAAAKSVVQALSEKPTVHLSGKHIIAHMQLCSNETIKLMARNDIAACLQPFWFFRGKNAITLDVQRLGQRADKQYPANSLARSGVKLLFGSDFPATENYDPLLGIKIASQVDGSGENISAQQAYRAYCVGTYETDNIVLSEEDPATFLILSNDICRHDNATVLTSYIDGICEYQQISGDKRKT